MHILLLLTNPCNEKYDTLVEIKKILSMHVNSFVDIFFCSFFKLIITEHKSHNFLPIFFRASPSSSISEDVQFTVKKITLLDEEYGCIVYSVLENNNQSVFFNLSSCKPEHNIMENCSTFFNQISQRFLFLFSQSSSLLLHSYVCDPPSGQLLTHTPVVPKKKRVEGRVHPDDIM